MRAFLYILFTTLLYSNSVFSQAKLSEYSYVLVPQQFEFQTGKDQFLLNSLVRHLFNSNGFNAIYDVEMGNLSNCDGLRANVIKEKAFLGTEVVITLTNCEGIVVFESAPGKSKLKMFKDAYREAINKAFQSIKALNVQQAELVRPTVVESTNNTIVKPDLEKSKYIHNNKSFSLQKKDGYYLFFNTSASEPILIGKLAPTSRKGTFLFSNEKENSLAILENDKLIIDRVSESGNTTQEIYILVRE